MKTRNGKIARLSQNLRQEINLRLEQSQPSPQLLAWLNALPEVQKLVQKHFNGEPVSRQNLSQWRQGGYMDWLARQDLWDGVRNMDDLDEDLGPDRDADLADKLARVLMARLACLLTRWDNQHSPEFEAKARALNGLCRTVLNLQKAAHRLEEEKERKEAAEAEALKEDFEERKQEHLGKIVLQLMAPRLSKILGDSPQAHNLARYIMAVQAGNLPEAKAIAREALAAEPAGPDESQSVKACQSDVEEETV